MRMYLSFFRMRFLTLIQYRAAALAGVATQWAFGLMRILVLHAFYASSDAAQPMSFEQTVTYVWIGQAMLGAFPSYADSAIMNSVLTGEVAYELTRPLDIYWMWFARTLALRTAPTLLRAVPQFFIALLLVPAPYKMALPTPAALAAWLTAATFGLLLSTAVTTLMSAFTLWTVRAEGITRFLPTLVMFFSGMYVPLRLMPAWAQLAGRLQPFAGMMDLPAQLFSGSLAPGHVAWIVGLQLSWCAIFVAAGRALMRGGLRRVTVAGG
ncbi:ABC transporter permease [Bacillota bacterium Meth-B3]